MWALIMIFINLVFIGLNLLTNGFVINNSIVLNTIAFAMLFVILVYEKLDDILTELKKMNRG